MKLTSISSNMNTERFRGRLRPVCCSMWSLWVAAFFFLQSGAALAQVDLSGEWAQRMHEDQQYRGPGPDYGEYEGFPINEAARLKAESWNASVYTLPERQCIPFAADHGLTFGSLRLSKEVDRA